MKIAHVLLTDVARNTIFTLTNQLRRIDRWTITRKNRILSDLYWLTIFDSFLQVLLFLFFR